MRIARLSSCRRLLIMALFPTDGALTPNLTAFGQPPAPNKATRIAPSQWTNYKIIRATTSAEKVPGNVYQMLAMVWGGGGNGTSTTPGGGAGFAMGVVDVTPGQLLPTLTVGTSAASSSFGSLLTATGGSGVTAGAGTAARWRQSAAAGLTKGQERATKRGQCSDRAGRRRW